MNKYYVITMDGSPATFGPFTFKVAVDRQDMIEVPCVIAKVVIDEEGKEVK